MPDLFYESQHAGLVAGVDEAGRGPWAGPVVAAAAILNSAHLPEGINDSKKLSKQKREALFDAILACAHTAIGIASVGEIDTLNILGATKLAMQRAVAALPVAPMHILIDGNALPALTIPATAIIEGDAKSLSIAAASIIAKVTRDRIMAQLALEFPHYGFERHAGYGTTFHQKALAAHGATAHHRRSFAPIRALLSHAQTP